MVVIAVVVMVCHQRRINPDIGDCRGDRDGKSAWVIPAFPKHGSTGSTQGILTIGTVRLRLLITRKNSNALNSLRENDEVRDDQISSMGRRGGRSPFDHHRAARSGAATGRQGAELRAGAGRIRLPVPGSAFYLQFAAAVAADGVSRRQAGPSQRPDRRAAA